MLELSKEQKQGLEIIQSISIGCSYLLFRFRKEVTDLGAGSWCGSDG